MKLLITTGLTTVTIAVAVALPPALVAVRDKRWSH